MEKNNITAVVAMHTPFNRMILEARMKAAGVEVRTVQTEEELVRALDSTSVNFVLMDANLGQIGSPDIGPAVRIYNRVLPKEQHFLALSDSYTTVDNGRKAGIPTTLTAEFVSGVIDYVQNPTGYLTAQQHRF